MPISGAWPALANMIEHVANAVGMRIGEVKALAVLAGRVGDVIGGGHDEIDGDEVDAAALDPDHRHPGRQDASVSA